MNTVGFGGRAVLGWGVALLAAIAVAVALILAGAPTRAAAQVAFSISIVSGNNQVGTINSPLPAPLVVRVTPISTVPLPAADVTVTWTVTSGGGVLATSTSVTNANGEASNTLTPTGPTTDVRASVPGSSVTFNETATPALDYALTNSGGVTVTAGASGATILTATLLAGSTQPVSFTTSGLPSGATAAFTPTSCSPTCSTTLTITTSAATPSGTFPITVTGSPLGRTTSFDLTVNAPFDYALTNSGGVTVAPGAAGATIITATLQAGSTQPVSFTASVSFTTSGLPSGVTVAFTPTSCSPTCSTTLTITTSAATPSGTFPITVTGSPLGRTTSFNLIVSPPTLAIAIGSGNSQTGTINTPLPAPLVVSVTQNGIPVAGQTVTWTISSGSGTLGSGTAVTNAGGLASNTLTPTGPSVTVTASIPGASVTFTATATALAVTITIVSGNNQLGVINSTLPKPLVVSVTPPTPSVTVLWEVTGGARPSATSTPTVNGLAQITLTLGPTPGPVTVRASVSGAGPTTSVVFIVNDVTQTAITGLKTYSVLGNLAITTATVQSTNIGLRLAALRRGGTDGVSLSGLSLNVAGQPMPLGAVMSGIPSGQGEGEGVSADPAKVLSGLGLFLNGQGSFGDQERTRREPGFKFNTQGLTLGSDYRVTEHVVLGAAFGYLHTAANLDQAGGRVKMNGYSVSAFGTYYVADKVYVDAIATYGWNRYGVTRHVTFGDTSATAKADPDANQWSVSVSGGYNFNFGPLTVGPTAKTTYINVNIDGFQERGADIFNLRVGGQTVASLATDLGAQISYAISTPWGVLLPLVHAEWEHEFKGGSRLITGSLLADPLRTTFGVPTNSPDRNYVNLASGITATLQHGISAFAHYETVLGRAHVTNHSFTAGVRFQFQ